MHVRLHERGSLTVLWTAFLAPPLVTLSALLALYALADPACRDGSRWAVHAVAVASIAVCLFALRAAWRVRSEHGPPWVPSSDAGPSAAERFLGALGVLSGALFALLCAAQWLAVLVLDPCPA